MNDACVEQLKRACNSLDMGMMQSGLAKDNAASTALNDALQVLSLGYSDAQAEQTISPHLQIWADALRNAPGEPLQFWHDSAASLQQALQQADSLAAFDDWESEEEALLMAALESQDEEVFAPADDEIAEAGVGETAPSAEQAETLVSNETATAAVVETPSERHPPIASTEATEAQESAMVDVAASDTAAIVEAPEIENSPVAAEAEPAVAAQAPQEESPAQATRSGRRGLALAKKSGGGLPSASTLFNVAEENKEEEGISPEPAPLLSATNKEQACAAFFSALPWERALNDAAAPRAEARAMPEHLHITPGERGTPSAPSGSNPILAATQQALASAAKAAQIAQPALDEEAMARLACAVFFNELPWEGAASASPGRESADV